MNIHKKIFIRLTIACIALSIVFGLTVFYLEHQKVNKTVYDLAVNESQLLRQDFREFYSTQNSAQQVLIQKKIHEHLEDGHFTAIRILDLKGNELFSDSATNMDHHQEMMDHGPAEKVMVHTGGERIKYTFNIFLHRVRVPTKSTAGETIGFFEGIYKVDKDRLTAINLQIFWAIIQVILVVFVTAGVLYPIIVLINRQIIQYSIALSKANIGMLEVLGSAIAKRDSDTNLHNYRVTIYAIRLAEQIGLEDSKISSLIKGAFLHDVGKIGISDAILLKPGKLTEEEFEIMKTHVNHGVDIVEGYDWLNDAIDVVQHHHEKFNGTGYMSRLKQDKIPITARIFAIADVFDALTSKRPYKEPFSFDETMKILHEGSGSHFDTKLIDAFTQIAPELYSEYSQSSESVLVKLMRDRVALYFRN